MPVAYLMIIIDETLHEEESDTNRNEGHGKRTDGTKIGEEIGQDGERRKTYSAAVIDGINRNSAIYVGYSIVMKADTRLSKGNDEVVCLPGARIEHVTERVEKIIGRRNGGSILVHIGSNNADKEGTTAIVEKYRNLLKKTKQARAGQIILSGILPVFGNRRGGEGRGGEGRGGDGGRVGREGGEGTWGREGGWGEREGEGERGRVREREGGWGEREGGERGRVGREGGEGRGGEG